MSTQLKGAFGTRQLAVNGAGSIAAWNAYMTRGSALVTCSAAPWSTTIVPLSVLGLSIPGRTASEILDTLWGTSEEVSPQSIPGAAQTKSLDTTTSPSIYPSVYRPPTAQR